MILSVADLRKSETKTIEQWKDESDMGLILAWLDLWLDEPEIAEVMYQLIEGEN